MLLGIGPRVWIEMLLGKRVVVRVIPDELTLLAGVNEFYQKGCQGKTSASTGEEMFSRDPAHGD